MEMEATDTSNKENTLALLLFADAEKALDRCTFLKSMVSRMDRVTMRRPNAFIFHQGNSLKVISLHRLVRQGFPISPILVNLCLEVLAITVRLNPNI